MSYKYIVPTLFRLFTYLDGKILVYTPFELVKGQKLCTPTFLYFYATFIHSTYKSFYSKLDPSSQGCKIIISRTFHSTFYTSRYIMHFGALYAHTHVGMFYRSSNPTYMLVPNRSHQTLERDQSVQNQGSLC